MHRERESRVEKNIDIKERRKGNGHAPSSQTHGHTDTQTHTHRHTHTHTHTHTPDTLIHTHPLHSHERTPPSTHTHRSERGVAAQERLPALAVGDQHVPRPCVLLFCADDEIDTLVVAGRDAETHIIRHTARQRRPVGCTLTLGC